MSSADLNRVICKIQHQLGKLEVIELIYLNAKNTDSSLEVEIAYKMICTLRQNLTNNSIICLNVFSDKASAYITSLQKTLVSVNNLLIEMSTGLNSSDARVIFLHELFSGIVSELTTINTELNVILQSFLTSVYTDSSFNQIEELLKNLRCKCLGDLEKVERLIQYEYKQNPQSSREKLIQSAIARWEHDNR